MNTTNVLAEAETNIFRQNLKINSENTIGYKPSIERQNSFFATSTAIVEFSSFVSLHIYNILVSFALFKFLDDQVIPGVDHIQQIRHIFRDQSQ